MTVTTEASATRMLSQTRSQATPVRFGRVLQVEFRKLFATWANRGLMLAILASALGAAGIGVLVFGQLQDQGAPWFMMVDLVGMLPHILTLPLVILMVTSEYSTRSAMTTFTLVPHRGSVVASKTIVAVTVSVATWLLCLGLGAASYGIGAAVNSATPVWDIELYMPLGSIAAQVLITLSAFALALLIQNGPATIVTVLAPPTVLGAAFMAPEWLQNIIAWINLQETLGYTVLQSPGEADTMAWARLACAAAVWIVIPAVLGTLRTLRREAA